MDGLKGSGATSAELLDAPEGYASGLPWLGVHVDSDLGDDVEPNWLGAVAQGAVADLMRADEERTADVIGGGVVFDTGPDGIPVTVVLGTGSIEAGQQFESPADAALRAHVQDVAKEFNLSVESIDIFHPLNSVIRVILDVPDGVDPQWTIDDLTGALAGSPKIVEALFVELRSPQGVALLRQGSAYRVGEGGLWTAPGQDVRFGATRSVPTPASSFVSP
ncbi:hypothetical protein [Nocardioides sp.]|uniref:hypothetical protein n=1 Tax=Nocardioides sp. TaxID=35761 RepID=UPI0039E60C1F